MILLDELLEQCQAQAATARNGRGTALEGPFKVALRRNTRVAPKLLDVMGNAHAEIDHRELEYAKIGIPLPRADNPDWRMAMLKSIGVDFPYTARNCVAK